MSSSVLLEDGLGIQNHGRQAVRRAGRRKQSLAVDASHFFSRLDADICKARIYRPADSSQALMPLPATAMAWTVDSSAAALSGASQWRRSSAPVPMQWCAAIVQSFVLQRCQQKLSLQQRVHVFASVHYQDSEAIVLQWRSAKRLVSRKNVTS